MNRRLLLIGIVVLLAGTILIILSKIKKGAASLETKNNKSVSVLNLQAQVKEFELKGDFLQAKSIYQELIGNFPNSNEVMNWQKRVEDINIKLLFSPAIIASKSIAYEIKPGDTLTKIAREFNTTVDLIKRSNNFNNDKIVPGRKIKVWNTPFNLLIDKSQNTLILKSDEEIFKTYIVSTGANNSTPVGTFKIVSKLENPTWFKAGAVVPPGSPENLLGTRWLGLNLAGYGIHGTNEPEKLGKQVTQGCVRMANSEVEELYVILPQGMEVTIVD